ncbi:putative protein [Arabidopsis thaliana]|uniref:Uncharacterized protein F24M12.400 n=1 Tax=Arabidopsis thaliana TaxID=3702 RepID=Q9SD13_ARATH|nr:putative protein [Arabidopsis thaliana]
MFQFGFLCAMSLGLASSVSGSLSFEIHHRFSEQVKTVLGGHGLPEMGSLDYYKALVHRDRGRQLTSNNNNQTTISFAQGNSTEEISLYDKNLAPPLYFHLTQAVICFGYLAIAIPLVYGVWRLTKARCISPVSDCPYRIRYLSPGSKSTGVLVEDVIHMSTEEGEARDARITFGESQLGLFKEVAVNGIMGLAIADIAVPNMLVKAGVASDSFSMCFGPNGKGTISFGDKGSSDQLETPLSGTISPMFYDVSITKFKVGKVTVDTEFTATFDSGTAVTWLIEPYYTALTTNFHLSVPDRRLSKSVDSPFEFCYIITSTSDEDKLPSVSFEMKGGAAYDVFSPILVFDTSDGSFQVYCLAVLKQVNADFSIIGRNDTNGFTGPTALAKPPSMAPTSSPRTINLSSRLNPLAAASSLFIICFISFVSL